MAQLPNGHFDANSVEERKSFDPMPPGDYLMHVVSSEMKPTRDNTGQLLVVECEVLDGTFKGRRVWENFNLVNKNPTAVKIAYEALGELARAVGRVGMSDSTELHNLPFTAELKVRPASKGYEARNEVKKFKAATGAAPAQPQPTTGAPAPAPAANGDGTPPWQRSAA